jgi:hypothetical protein
VRRRLDPTTTGEEELRSAAVHLLVEHRSPRQAPPSTFVSIERRHLPPTPPRRRRAHHHYERVSFASSSRDETFLYLDSAG